MTTSTRYVGTCAVCEGRVKVRGGTLVHHGYRRPGHGYIVGDCFAVGLLPHEVSSATARAYLDYLTTRVADLETAKEQVASATELVHEYTRPNGIGFGPRVTETVHVKKGDRGRYEGPYRIPSFDDVQKGLLDQLTYELISTRNDAARMTRLIETWTEQPLITVEEEMARVTAELKAARAIVKAERDAKKAVQKARKDARAAKLMAKLEVAKVKAQAILDAVEPSDVRAVREAYLKVLAIKLPSDARWTFYDEDLNRTELLRSAGLVRPQNGRLMTYEYEIRALLAGR